MFPSESTSEAASTYSAVQLFVQTARRIQPNFSLARHQASVIDICQVVEGMPLGIELGATWLRVMPCDQIAGQIRLDLDFLETPMRNIPDRHRNLRALFDHSWMMLSEAERHALMKLSAFRGGIDPEAAKEVAQAPLRLLASLVDKSLVRLNPSDRYDMHELLRQFAADKLRESNQTYETQKQHAQYFLELVEEVEQHLFGPQHIGLLDQLEKEHDNFRAALDWASQVGEVELGLQLAGALGWFWNRRTYWREGCEWLEYFLKVGNDSPLSIRAKAVHHLMELNNDSYNWGRLKELYEAWVVLVDEVENTKVKAWLLTSLGYAGISLFTISLPYLNEALALFTSINDQWGVGETLSRLSGAWHIRGNFDWSDELMQKGIQLARQEGDKSILSWMLMNLANQYWSEGRMDSQTERINQEALILFQELGYKHGSYLTLCQLGHIAHFRGEDEKAKSLFEQCLIIGQQINARIYTALALFGLAHIYCLYSEPERGTKLLGAIADSMRVELAEKSPFDNKPGIDFEHTLAIARDLLDEEIFNAAFSEGQQMTLESAIVYALAKPNLASDKFISHV